MPVTNQTILEHRFLAEMFDDSYYPDAVVKQGEDILLALCAQIEATSPGSLDALYVLTHAATERFNDLAAVFDEQDSDIDTVARECISVDMLFIAQAYGFADADIDDLTSPRDW